MASPLRAGASVEEELEYYKKQYEQLEADLGEFQASSKDLEAQLEADIDAAEKNERKLRQEKEQLQFEVDEWKAKNKSAREEGNRAQNTLQKEITQLREEKRSLDLRLRDVEVVNDDYERQARHTEVSLEDLESKYNSSIERAVMLEEEVRVGEQEREQLRIESQRLRDELGDLRVENDITLEKLRGAEQTIEQLRNQRKPSTLAVESLRGRDDDVASEGSGFTPNSPAASTTPAKSEVTSEALTPPSPPLSDVQMDKKPEPKTPMPQRPRSSLMPDTSATPRALGLPGARATPATKHIRGASVASTSTTAAKEGKMQPPTSRRPRQSLKPSSVPEKLPRAESLIQIRSLMGRMQKIEERVQSARSKLPAPSKSTPTGSPRIAGSVAQSTPRTGSAMSGQLPGSVTLRRSSKRPSESSRISFYNNDAGESTADETPDFSASVSGRRDSHIKRLSYGIPRPTSRAGDRPPSAAGKENSISTPGKRQSISGISSLAIPTSRAGTSGRSSAMDFSDIASPRQPRTSVAGKHATIHGTPRSHRPSASVSELKFRNNGPHEADTSPTDFRRSFIGPPSTNRRTTLDKKGIALSTPGASKTATTLKASTQRTPPVRQSTTAHRNSTFFSPSSSTSKSPNNPFARPSPARHESTPGRIVNGVTRKFAAEGEATVVRKDGAGRIIRPRASTNKSPDTSPQNTSYGNVSKNMGPPPRRRQDAGHGESIAPLTVSNSYEEDDLGETF